MTKQNEYTKQIRALAHLVLSGWNWWELIRRRKSIAITLYELTDKIHLLESLLESEKEDNTALTILNEDLIKDLEYFRSNKAWEYEKDRLG